MNCLFVTIWTLNQVDDVLCAYTVFYLLPSTIDDRDNPAISPSFQQMECCHKNGCKSMLAYKENSDPLLKVRTTADVRRT